MGLYDQVVLKIEKSGTVINYGVYDEINLGPFGDCHISGVTIPSPYADPYKDVEWRDSRGNHIAAQVRAPNLETARELAHLAVRRQYD